VGSFGVIAIALQFGQTGVAVIWTRFSGWSHCHGGAGRAFGLDIDTAASARRVGHVVPRWGQLATRGALGAIIALAAHWAPWLLVAVPAIMIWRMWIMRRIGGISGDGHGAGIELAETAPLLSWAAAR
jgi:adenosylcobinamide-GDP ribazoletransferase